MQARPDQFAVWFRHYFARHADTIAAWLAR
jgi:uncharacterized protein YdiU (UPF0061 family)